jgi:hypothetical protein
MPLVRGLVHVADQHLELTDLGPTPLGGAAVTLAPQAAELAPEWFCQRSRQTACLSCRSGAGGVQDKGTGTRRDCVANWFAAATERPECTARGYRRFRCRDCGKQFNGLGCSVCTCLRPEPWFGMAGRRRLGQIRVGLAFKGRQFAAEVILWAVRWYLMFPVSYRDLALMLRDRVEVDHSTVVRRIQASAQELEKRIRPHLRRSNRSWRVNAIYTRVKGVGLICIGQWIAAARRSTFCSRQARHSGHQALLSQGAGSAAHGQAAHHRRGQEPRLPESDQGDERGRQDVESPAATPT